MVDELKKEIDILAEEHYEKERKEKEEAANK